LVGESERRGSLGRARDRWKDDVKINNGGVNVSILTGLIWLGKNRETVDLPRRILVSGVGYNLSS